jgi:cell division septation protein DedD
MSLLAACSTVDSHLQNQTGSRTEQKGIMPNDPALSQAHVNRAKFFRTQGEVNKSIQEMEWALAADPYNYETAYHLGLLYLDRNQRISARRVWEQGLLADQDGVERPDRGRAVAAMRAAVAELDRIEKPYGTPISILASQGAYQDNLRGTLAPPPGAHASSPQGNRNSSAGGLEPVPEWAAGASSSVPALPPVASYSPSGPLSGDTSPPGQGLSYSRPGLPPGGAYPPGAFVPQPYIPKPEDSKPRPAAPAPASRPAAAAKPAPPGACPPCGVQNSGKYAVLVSSNRRQASAQEQVKLLLSKGYQANMAINKNAQGSWYVVWAGCCVPEKQARELAAALNKQGLARGAKAAVPR